MENKKKLINKILIGLDSGGTILDDWRFRYNNTIKGIEAYNDEVSIVEAHSFSTNGVEIINEDFEKVVERLLIKLKYFE